MESQSSQYLFLIYLNIHIIYNISNFVYIMLYVYSYSCNTLLEVNQQLADSLLLQPEKMLHLFDEAIVAAQQQILRLHPSSDSMCLKPNCHARLHHLPLCPEIERPNVSSIRSSDYGINILYIYYRSIT